MASMGDDIKKNLSRVGHTDLPFTHTFQAHAQMKAEEQEYEESNPQPSYMGGMAMDGDYERKAEIGDKFRRICGDYHRGSATVRRGDVIVPKKE